MPCITDSCFDPVDTRASIFLHSPRSGSSPLLSSTPSSPSSKELLDTAGPTRMSDYYEARPSWLCRIEDLEASLLGEDLEQTHLK